MRETLRRNRVHDGIVYLQVTRGVARRDHAFPPPGTQPSVVVTARNLDMARNERAAAAGVAVITVPDNRWERVDIKSISLLPNVLAKQAAREQGAGEAWFVDRDGKVTEGSSSNAWIVTMGGKVVTRAADKGILRGITRTVLIGAIEAQGLTLEERPFTVEEAYRAREAFLTAASQVVLPVVRIDGRPVGNGAPGSGDRAPKDFHHERLNPNILRRGGFAPNLCLHGPRPCLVMAASGSVKCKAENGHSDPAISRGKGPAREKWNSNDGGRPRTKSPKTPSEPCPEQDPSSRSPGERVKLQGVVTRFDNSAPA
jgi:D-alanine transaminase